MMEAIFMLGTGFLGGMAGGGLMASWFLYRFSRRCTSLEWAIGDLQTRASTFKGREMAEKRWTKKDDIDVEMAQILRTGDPPRKRYDNDPLA